LADAEASWRFYVMAFGGANLSGLILVMTYPFALATESLGKREIWALQVIAVLNLWLMSLLSLSRATPVVMAAETLVLVVILRRKVGPLLTVAALGLALLMTLPLLPREYIAGWVERFQSSDLIGYFLGSPLKLGTGELQRTAMREMAWEDIKENPFGGMAWQGRMDAENIILDTALQLGWAPALALAGILGVCLIRAYVLTRRSAPHQGALFRAVFVSALGTVVYVLTTGTNLAKVGIMLTGNAVVMQSNATSTLFLVCLLALSSADLLCKPRLEAVHGARTERRSPS